MADDLPQSPKPAHGRQAKNGGGEARPTPPPTNPFIPHRLSPEDRIQAGRSLREADPRRQHADWQRDPDRPDPIAMLKAADVGRSPEETPIRYGRMLLSPFTFFRGAAAIMAMDLAPTPNTGIRVQTCGDCHLLNFGGFATPDHRVIFDLNDFDETAPGPWEWDLKRLVTSFVLAARAARLSDDAAQDLGMTCARSYRQHMHEFVHMSPVQVWHARVTADDVLDELPARTRASVSARIERVSNRDGSEMDFPKLAGLVGGQIAIRDQPGLIHHPEESRTPEFHDELRLVFNAYRETLSEDRRELLDRYRVLDAAIKTVGIGGVGRRCWILLLMSNSNAPLFLQFKEAGPSVLEPYTGESAYAHHGQRVVAGQRLMQPVSDPFLGWVTAGSENRQYHVRWLYEAKIKPLVEAFNEELFVAHAKACGWVLARAHARAGDAAKIAGYLGSGDQFDEAMGGFSIAYADQTERDHAALKAAVRRGMLTAFTDV
jgi:uncharacterized protein (DUF2252 family)